MLPCSSCSLPGAIARRQGDEQPPSIYMDLLLLGLAPAGGYLAASIAGGAGGLLHHLFTLTGSAGGMSLWPSAAGYPTPGVARQRALRSADFPRPGFPDRGRPTSLGTLIIPSQVGGVNIPTFGEYSFRKKTKRNEWGNTRFEVYDLIVSGFHRSIAVNNSTYVRFIQWENAPSFVHLLQCLCEAVLSPKQSYL